MIDPMSLLATAVNLDQPGRYLHWSIFTVSVANLVLIAVMVVIFGVALLLPFSSAHHEAGGAPAESSSDSASFDMANLTPGDDDAGDAMWTARIRRHALRLLPPGKLLPDHQPAYVASWVYVFGVATLAALGMAIVSGMVIALGGVDWWHSNAVGHFFNSLHLWSVELFMALLVIHLCAKFWMAAWRGRRNLTWITGVVAFVASVAPTDPIVAIALDTYRAAGSAKRRTWDQNYLQALDHVTFHSGTPLVPAANDASVPLLISTELTLARSGALDADLLAQQPFYGTNFTKPLLFLEDGSYFASQAIAQHLNGTQWGVMNETGSYPGQPWLWLYNLWYQVPGFDKSANVDLVAIYLTGAATLLLLAVPFLPGLRDIPRLVPVHRLVWRNWNRTQAAMATLLPTPVPPTAPRAVDSAPR
jgi:hypothetical protein